MSGRAPTILVAALGAGFGVALLQVSGALSAAIAQDPFASGHGTVTAVLTIVSLVFTGIAVYVGGVVTVNTVATVVAGRAREIALLRLLGAPARRERARIGREGLFAGAIGGLIGVLVGTGVAVGIVRLGAALKWMPDAGYSFVEPVVLVPVLAVVATTWLAALIGSRRVLDVTPLQALASSHELSREETVRRPRRTVLAVTLFVVGTAILLGGVALGLVTPLGVLVGVVGGILSFTGVVIGAHLVVPLALRAVGAAAGRSVPARVARENAVRNPERSTRSTIGVVIGVTLVTMFAVAIASFRALVEEGQRAQPEVYQGVNTLLDALTATFSVLVGFSALIAAVGLVNTLSLSVLQRRRELGLLRAVGLSVRQLRAMVLLESAQLTVTAVLLGIVLGTFYGWCGAQSLLGSVRGIGQLVAPGIPWTVLGALVAAAAVLALVAAIVPTRRATRVSPVEALAAD